jgi:DNA-directed RNA polymerase subunit RPC12/RpoP
MKPIKQKLYGYSCEVCGTKVYLLESAEKYLYCPFCGEKVNDLTPQNVMKIRIDEMKDYESGN